MKVIISEQQYEQVLLLELGNRGKGLLSYIRQNYEVMGNSFTPRFGGGVKWFTRDNIIDELIADEIGWEDAVVLLITASIVTGSSALAFRSRK